MSERAHVGAVGQWGVPHCEDCGEELWMIQVESFEVMMGEVMVWECGAGHYRVWEAVLETGWVIGAYTVPDANGIEHYPWFRAGWRMFVNDQS